MKTSVEHVDPTKVKLTVVVPAEDVDHHIDAAYTRMTKKVKIPGFRAGKAPKAMVDTHVGREAVLADAQDEILSTSYGEALDAESLRPIEQPEVSDLELIVPGEEWEYTAEVQIRPEYALTSIDDLTVELPPGKATEEQIDERIDEYRERFAELEPIKGRGVTDSDFVLLSFGGEIDGEEYEGNKVDKYLYEMGQGLMNEAFEEAMIGLEPGSTTHAEFVIPESSTNPDFVGKTATFDIEIHEIQGRKLPEVNDEFATNVGGFESVDELREKIREELDAKADFARKQAREDGARRALAARLEGEIPEPMINNTQNAMYRDFTAGLEARETNLTEYMQQMDLDLGDIETELRDRATKSVEDELALEALARQLKFEVEEDDIQEALEEMAGTDPEGVKVDELRQRWEEAGVMSVIHEQILQKKAVAWLMEEDHVDYVEMDPNAAAADDDESSPEQDEEE